MEGNQNKLIYTEFKLNKKTPINKQPKHFGASLEK